MPSNLFDPAAPMDVSRTVAVYETLRHRGPTGEPGGAERRKSLRDILARFDALLLDGYGVLNTGAKAVPGAASLIDDAGQAGLAVLVLTNGASNPSSLTAMNYRGLGLSIDDEQVVSSRDAMLGSMAGEPGPIGVVGGVAQLPEGDRYTALDPTQPDQWLRVASIAFVGSIGWNLQWQDCLSRAMAAEIPVHVANPDVAAPHEGEFSLEPGFWVAKALDEHPGAVVHWYGKPHGPVFDLALERLEAISGRRDWDRDRLAMVGDSLHTDILGANAAGIKSVLVTGHGLFRGGGAEEAMELTGIRPDFIAATVWDT